MATRSGKAIIRTPYAGNRSYEPVKFLRYGEARGDCDHVVEVLNATDPHGR
jgi:uncharacterized oxidoreductase